MGQGLLAVLAFLAQAALQGQQQGDVGDDAVGAADDGLGHVLRQGDAAAGQQGDRVPQLVFHQFQVAAADQVLQVQLAGVSHPPGLFRARQVEDLGPRRGQGRDPVRGLAVRRHLDPDDQLGITLLDGLHLGHHAGVVRESPPPDLGQQRVIQV